MKQILAIQHIGCEPLGLFEAEATGLAEFAYVRSFLGEWLPDSLDGFDGIIVLGGPMAVYESDAYGYLKSELELLKLAVAADFPLLGVCLGAQLIADAAGGRVYAGPKREIGWSEVVLTEAGRSDAVFQGLPDTIPVFQLHGDTFELPAGAVRLAGNDIYDNQAFRVGKRVYGLQFHVEVSEDLVRGWTGEYCDYMTGAGASPGDVLDNLHDRSERLRPIAAQVIRRFLDLC
ncbi:MAG: type 1 glutamine amidotransferase [Thermoleophilia bacterium]